MSDLSFWKVVSMRVLGGRIVLVEGEASRETQSGGEAWPNVARVIRQAYPLTIMTIDRDYPARLPLPLVVAARDDRAGRTLRASARLVVLDITWAVNHQRVGGEGKVRSVRERQ